MGKNKHSQDKIYKTVGELASKHVGQNREIELSALHRRLKFDHCCLTLNPINENAIGICDGTQFCYVFDCLAITSFLQKYNSKHPITGKQVSKSNLINLKYHRNEEGKYHCPVTLKVFSQFSKIVAYKKSGNVISYDAYYTLNLKKNNFKDLITDEAIRKEDVVTIQDPDLSETKWSPEKFYYVQQNIDIFKIDEISANEQSDVLKSVLSEYKDKSTRIVERFNKILGQDEVKESTSILDKFNSAEYSDGLLAKSVTSTVMPIQTSMNAALLTEEQVIYPRVKKKGYVQILTNFGPLNIELFCDRTPKACHNFILLSKRGYYDDTTFHRLIKNFIIQGGDPTGTGSGGQSAWGKPFEDECRGDLKHNDRGMVAMANSGPATNKSQFYITLRGNGSHLDGKHTVFGQLVGGEETLAKMESVEVDKKDRPKQRIELKTVKIFVDPFEEIKKGIEEERQKQKQESQVDNPSLIEPALKKIKSGIGSYIQIDRNAQAPAIEPKKKSNDNDARIDMLRDLAKIKPNPVKARKNFGDFSSW